MTAVTHMIIGPFTRQRLSAQAKQFGTGLGSKLSDMLERHDGATVAQVDAMSAAAAKAIADQVELLQRAGVRSDLRELYRRKAHIAAQRTLGRRRQAWQTHGDAAWPAPQPQ